MGDIKTRFTLEGEQKFKSAMSDAANAIKVLNSEQKLAKAQFQNTGNAEKYAADQARILKEKIQQQQQAVKAAEQALKQLAANGVAQNTRQFQQWQMRLNNAQTSLVNMETELQNLGSSMTTASGKTEQFSDSLDNIGKKVNYDAVINGIGKITDKMEAAARKAVEMASSLISSMKDAASWADDLATTATVYGVDTDTLQRMKYTANILDTSTDAIIKSRQKLVSNMVNGGDEVQQLFTSLGVAVQEFSPGKYGAVATGYRDWADVFWDLGAALTNLEQTKGFEEANAAATKLLGRNWEQLKPLFNSDWASEDNYMGRAFDSAREYYEAVMGSWDTVSDENVNKLTKLDDALQKLQANYEVLKETVLATLAPAFEQVSNALSTLLTEFNKYLETDEGKQKLQDLSEAVTNLFSGITDIDFGTAMDTAKDAFDKLVNGLTWISNNWETVKLALEGLAGAFALLKISQGVLTFMQLLSSGKYLFGSKKLTDDLNGLNGGNGGTGGVGTGGQQTVATETVTNQNVTNATVSNETVSSQQVGNATATALNATNANVTTMYVGTLITGGGTPGSPTNNPTTPLLDGGGNGFNGYVPMLPVGGGGGDLSLPGVDTVNLGGGDTTLNLPSGGDNTIELPPSDYSIDGGNGGGGDLAGPDTGVAAEEAARHGLKAWLGSEISGTPLWGKVLGGAALTAILTLTPSDAAGGLDEWTEEWIESQEALKQAEMDSMDALARTEAELQQAKTEAAEAKHAAETLYESENDPRILEKILSGEYGGIIGRNLGDMGSSGSWWSPEHIQWAQDMYSARLSGDSDKFWQMYGVLKNSMPGYEWDMFSNLYGRFMSDGRWRTEDQLPLGWWSESNRNAYLDWWSSGNEFVWPNSNEAATWWKASVPERDDTIKLGITQAMRDAAETYWDAWRNEDIDDETWEAAADAFEEAFKGHESIMQEIEDRISALTGEENAPEDLPDDWFAEVPTEPKLKNDSAQQLQSTLQEIGPLSVRVRPILSGGIAALLGLGSDGEHANGLPYVPFNGYRAVLHKGERVLTAREAASYNSSSNLYVENMNMNGGMDAQALADAMSARNKRVSAGFGW